jgi:hypothetical protein
MGAELAGIILIGLVAVTLFFVIRRKSSELETDARQVGLDTEARRFARLLAAEIKLYNEYKVQRGLKNNDLYDFLQPEIDEARELYKKRIAGVDLEKHFDEALAEVLADGDKTKLDSNYNSKNR